MRRSRRKLTTTASPVIASDVIGILDALGVKQARVVGHDWGAALTWYLALTRPDRIERVVALSVGANGNSGAAIARAA